MRTTAPRGETPAAADFRIQAIRVLGRGLLTPDRIAEVGARVDAGGPGAAYDTFRASPDYGPWELQATEALRTQAAPDAPGAPAGPPTPG